jgi:drug/metabolite transporter (DMT)-like permease
VATPLWAIALALFAQVIGSFGALGLKLGARHFSLRPLALLRNYYLMGGLAGYGGSSVLVLIALKHGELSVIYPMVALTYVFVALLSQWLLKERMTVPKWIGICLILAGVSAIGLGSA